MESNSSNQISNTNSKINLNKNIIPKNTDRSSTSCGKQKCTLKCIYRLISFFNEYCFKKYGKENEKIKELNTKKIKIENKIYKKKIEKNRDRCICGIVCDVKKLKTVKTPFYCFFCPTIYCSFGCFITNLDDHKKKCSIAKCYVPMISALD